MSKTRRQFLCDCGVMSTALIGSSLFPSMVFSKEGKKIREKLTMYGPPVSLSVTLARLADINALPDLVKDLDFGVYRDPDILRTNFITQKWDLAGTPSYVAANLYNKGLKVKLMNIMSWGLLYVVSLDEKIKTIEDLKGQDIVMPFKGDLPDLVFQHVAQQKGMKITKDYHLNYVSSPFEGVQLLLSGRAKHAVLPEPAATAIQLKALKSSKKIMRSISLQKEWGEVTGGPERIPQAGMMVSDSLLNEIPELPNRLNKVLLESTKWVLDNPASAGVLGKTYMPLKAPVIEKSIPYSNFTLVTAKEAQSELENFFSILAKNNPAIIGGKLPDDDFYLG